MQLGKSLKQFFIETLPKALLLRKRSKGKTPEQRDESSAPQALAEQAILRSSESSDQGNPQDIVPLRGGTITCRREDRAFLGEILDDLNEKNPQTNKNIEILEVLSRKVHIVLDNSHLTRIEPKPRPFGPAWDTSKPITIYFKPYPSTTKRGVGERSFMPRVDLGTAIDQIANPNNPEYHFKKDKFTPNTYRAKTLTAYNADNENTASTSQPATGQTTEKQMSVQSALQSVPKKPAIELPRSATKLPSTPQEEPPLKKSERITGAGLLIHDMGGILPTTSKPFSITRDGTRD
jgi:hypothetical protein